MRHSRNYGKITALEAFEKSSNIAFAKMIIEAYGDDPATYVSRLHNMKLVEKLNLDIGGEGYAYITSPDDPQWSGSTLASLGYGYALTVTPMHILTFYNAVANGGKMLLKPSERLSGVWLRKVPPRYAMTKDTP